MKTIVKLQTLLNLVNLCLQPSHNVIMVLFELLYQQDQEYTINEWCLCIVLSFNSKYLISLTFVNVNFVRVA